MHPILKTSSYIWGSHLLLPFSLHLSKIIGGGAFPGYGTDLMTNCEDTDNYGDKILIIMVTRRMSEFEELRESNYWKLVTSVHI